MKLVAMPAINRTDLVRHMRLLQEEGQTLPLHSLVHLVTIVFSRPQPRSLVYLMK